VFQGAALDDAIFTPCIHGIILFGLISWLPVDTRLQHNELLTGNFRGFHFNDGLPRFFKLDKLGLDIGLYTRGFGVLDQYRLDWGFLVCSSSTLDGFLLLVEAYRSFLSPWVILSGPRPQHNDVEIRLLFFEVIAVYLSENSSDDLSVGKLLRRHTIIVKGHELLGGH